MQDLCEITFYGRFCSCSSHPYFWALHACAISQLKIYIYTLGPVIYSVWLEYELKSILQYCTTRNILPLLSDSGFWSSQKNKLYIWRTVLVTICTTWQIWNFTDSLLISHWNMLVTAFCNKHIDLCTAHKHLTRTWRKHIYIYNFESHSNSI